MALGKRKKGGQKLMEMSRRSKKPRGSVSAAIKLGIIRGAVPRGFSKEALKSAFKKTKRLNRLMRKPPKK
jgi:hypothetical protein